MKLLSVVVLSLIPLITLARNTTSTSTTTHTTTSSTSTSTTSTSTSISSTTTTTTTQSSTSKTSTIKTSTTKTGSQTSTTPPVTTSTRSQSTTTPTTTVTSTGTTTAPPGSFTPGTCVIQCSQAAAIKNGCGSTTNTICVCSSLQFQDDVGSCINFYCKDQLAGAVALQQSICTPFHLTPSGSATSTPFTVTNLAQLTGSGSSTDNTPQNTDTAPPSAGEIIRVSYNTVLTAVGVVLFGGLIGGGILL